MWLFLTKCYTNKQIIYTVLFTLFVCSFQNHKKNIKQVTTEKA